MTNDKTARVLSSAARGLLRRARKKSGTDTKAAYREAIVLVNRPLQTQRHIDVRWDLSPLR
jgi:hypothetical protein